MVKTVDEKIEAAQKMVSDLCHQRRRWIMSIPARPDYDPDLVIGGALRAARGEIEALRNTIKDLDFPTFEGTKTGRMQCKEPNVAAPPKQVMSEDDFDALVEAQQPDDNSDVAALKARIRYFTATIKKLEQELAKAKEKEDGKVS